MSYHASKKRPTRRPKQVDQAFLESAALSYLDRFDATAAKLRRVLLTRVRNEQRKAALVSDPPVQPEPERITQWIDELVQRYQSSGVLDDARFARNAALGLRGRGASRRAIAFKLQTQGVDEPLVDQAIAAADEHDVGPAELAAARRLVRRRRLGPHRPESERAPNRQKDLAALARAGFSFETARAALAVEDEKEF